MTAGYDRSVPLSGEQLSDLPALFADTPLHWAGGTLWTHSETAQLRTAAIAQGWICCFRPFRFPGFSRYPLSKAHGWVWQFLVSPSAAYRYRTKPLGVGPESQIQQGVLGALDAGGHAAIAEAQIFRGYADLVTARAVYEIKYNATCAAYAIKGIAQVLRYRAAITGKAMPVLVAGPLHAKNRAKVTDAAKAARVRFLHVESVDHAIASIVARELAPQPTHS